LTQPSVYTKDQFLKRPLTEDEVVAAVSGWDRKKRKVDDKTYRIFQKIADSRVLPPRASLDFDFNWYHLDERDEHEFLVWRIDLDVMTSETTGYTFRIRDDRLDHRPALLPSPSYAWIVKPQNVTPRPGAQIHAHNGVTLETRNDQKGALLVTVGWLQREDMHGWRLVAFDEKANRFILDRSISAGSGVVTMQRFRLDPAVLPADKVKHLGFEAVSGANLRRVSELAVRQAREKGVEILPWPQVGRPYEFTLTTTDGQVIDSRKLRGNVLLIDGWASWCGPCMTKMPKLKRVYDKWHAKGLEVLCLSFDMDLEAAKAAFKSHEIPWPMVLVPDDEEVRQLWREAVRLPPIPRVLLIDQRGVLRSDLGGVDLTQPEQIEKAVAALYQSPSADGD